MRRPSSMLRSSLVQLRPHRASDLVSFGRTALVTDAEGAVNADAPLEGLWVFETRMLSRYVWLVDGRPAVPAGASPITQERWLGYFIQRIPNWRATDTHERDPAQQTLELRISRTVGDGLSEDVVLTNHTQIATTVRLELLVDADFADPGETRDGRAHVGARTRAFRALPDGRCALVFDHRAEHVSDHEEERRRVQIARSTTLEVACDGPPPVDEGRGLAFHVELAPRASWRAWLRWTPTIDGKTFEPAPAGARRSGAFAARATKFEVPGGDTLADVVLRSLDRARDDLACLRLPDLDVRDHAWVVAGGVPVYLTLFGRDALIASWEAGLLSAEMMQGALVALAKSQATRDCAWRDEQPGRIVHEVHEGPRATLGFSPHGRYYGDATSSLFYPFVVSALWRWLGDEERVRPLVAPALRALAWADRRGDLDGDGFYEYATRSEQGEKNQGWKDSQDAIVYPDGAQVEDPLGTCEMQAFGYASKMRLAEVLLWLGEVAEARRLRREARALKRRFNAAFWVEEEQFLALGLDADKKPVRSVACDPGLCLMSGIVDRARVAKVVARLMSPELFSGWGIRTLSSEHPAYDPFAYHRGTVWPVANAMIALGFARYGFVRELHALAKAHFEAAALFEHARLPECFAGHARDETHPFPGLYPRANWPQAWSASSMFMMLEAMLGIRPYAAARTLFVDPHLPAWLPDLTVRDLRVGDATVSLRFRRRASGDDARTSVEVLARDGALRVVRQASPLSLFAGIGGRVRDVVGSLLPSGRA